MTAPAGRTVLRSRLPFGVIRVVFARSAVSPFLGNFLSTPKAIMTSSGMARTLLAILLRIFPAVQLVIAKFAALLRSDRGSAEPRTTEFVGEALGTDRHAAVLKPSSDYSIAAPESNGQSEREKLIRRRWHETAIKMCNPDFHGAGHAALNIQGHSKLLPPKSGETLPRYDKLEFELIAGRIVCEGVVVDPPKSRRKPRGRPVPIGDVRF